MFLFVVLNFICVSLCVAYMYMCFSFLSSLISVFSLNSLISVNMALKSFCNIRYFYTYTEFHCQRSLPIALGFSFSLLKFSFERNLF